MLPPPMFAAMRCICACDRIDVGGRWIQVSVGYVHTGVVPIGARADLPTEEVGGKTRNIYWAEKREIRGVRSRTIWSGDMLAIIF